MAISVLPIDSSSPNYTVDIELSGQLYRFRVLWNSRQGTWSMGLFLPDDTPLIRSVNIVSNYELFRGYTDVRLPIGNIYCIDTTGLNKESGYDGLGDTHIIIYDDLS